MGERVSTTDLYESTYYLLGGCELESIEAERVGGTISCRLTFRGEKIEYLQQEYFGGRAVVGLISFRRTLGRINAMVWSVKKRARARLRQERIERGEL